MKSIVIKLEHPRLHHCEVPLVSQKVYEQASLSIDPINMREAIADSIKEQMDRSEK